MSNEGGLERGGEMVRRFCPDCRTERDVEIANTSQDIGDGWEARDWWCLHCGAFAPHFWTAPGEYADLVSSPRWVSA